MKARERLDKILDIANEKVQEEVSALTGADFKLSEFSSYIASKEQYFGDLVGKKIVARMDLLGDLEGKGCLLVDLKDGIRLGGILIMLPQSELEEVIKSENYSEELEDSYGEIANIVAGAFTKVFEENYPKSLRFVRMEQEILSPAKVDIESEDPYPVQSSYVVRARMIIDGAEAGFLDFVIPATPFGLVIPEQEIAAATEETPPEPEPKVASQEQPVPEESPEDPPEEHLEEPSSPSPDAIQPPSDATAAVSADSAEPAESADTASPAEVAERPEESTPQKKPSVRDPAKLNKLVDTLLEQSAQTCGQEIGALLGVSVKLGTPQNSFVDKEAFFFDELSGKQVLAQLDVVEELQGKAFLAVSLKDAIRIGSTLIMLPPSELESAVNEEDFTPDAEDAYGEIANIAAGAYTSIFQDQYVKQVRFVRKELETVSPMRVDVESDDIIPRQLYYQSKCSLEIDGTQYGDLFFLLPAEVFGLGEQKAEEPAAPKQAEKEAVPRTAVQKPSPGTSLPEAGASLSTEKEGAPVPSGDFEVLIIQNSRDTADKIAAELDNAGVSSMIISYNDPLRNYIGDTLRLVIVVMREVDEQGYSAIIKVNTLSAVPILAAGSQWTRSKVIKAVKYGVSDILLIPATGDDIREKLHANMMALAA